MVIQDRCSYYNRNIFIIRNKFDWNKNFKHLFSSYLFRGNIVIWSYWLIDLFHNNKYLRQFVTSKSIIHK